VTGEADLSACRSDAAVLWPLWLMAILFSFSFLDQ